MTVSRAKAGTSEIPAAKRGPTVTFENLAQCGAEQCSRYAGNILFSYNNTDMTYAEAWTRICAKIRLLENEGFRAGDVIGLLSET